MNILFFLVWVYYGVICYIIADYKGYNKYYAFMLGMLFGVYSGFAYLIINKKTKYYVREKG